MYLRKKSLQGFTLLELMVAMTLSLIIGITAYTVLQSVVKTNEVEGGRAAELVKLQKAVWIISSDLFQMDAGSVVTDPNGTRVSFVRRGWPNPLALPRSDLLQVAYVLEGRKLKRYYGPYDQAAPQAALLTQTVINDVSGFSISVSTTSVANFTLSTPIYGELKRTVEVTRP